MSKAREWADRMRETRPSLTLISDDVTREANLTAEVTENGCCEVTVIHSDSVRRLTIPHDLCGALGRFLTRTFAESPGLIHGRPHDAKMAEDHE